MKRVDFWLWLCRIAFKRLKNESFSDRNRFGKVPVGIPTIRDPDAPCDAYRPLRDDATWGCPGDGHYLCGECSHHRRWRRTNPELADLQDRGEWFKSDGIGVLPG